jgi:hypothetical protein
MGDECTIYEWGDTSDRKIDNYVCNGIGNVASIVAEYVKDADDTGV